MMAGLLVLMVYKPFMLRDRGWGRGGKNTSGSVPVPVPGSAYEASVRAARGVLSAALELAVMRKSTSTSTSTAPAMGSEGGKEATPTAGTTFLDLYPLDKTLFEACVICAHAVLRPRPLSSSCFGYAPATTGAEKERERGVLTEEVGSALDLLSSSSTSTCLTDRQRRIVFSLRRRLARTRADAGEGAHGPGADVGPEERGSGKGRIKAGEVTPTRAGLKRRREEDGDGDDEGGAGAGRGFGGSINLHPNPNLRTALNLPSTTTAVGTECHHPSSHGAGMVSGFDYNPFPTLQYQLPPQMHVEQNQNQNQNPSQGHRAAAWWDGGPLHDHELWSIHA
ncbi:hypothetical protein NLJ89_g12165 [Agrocybe chaxingu]|uniref:Uncharacterized protein n=1 Tax=Agrocybe chaxingu TaxID=84603 RepID=A0A9W8JUY4_9AGAR|nr:hypothetical protein NLJ89_g12165 [Agrocybe chaxingu]